MRVGQGQVPRGLSGLGEDDLGVARVECVIGPHGVRGREGERDREGRRHAVDLQVRLSVDRVGDRRDRQWLPGHRYRERAALDVRVPHGIREVTDHGEGAALHIEAGGARPRGGLCRGGPAVDHLVARGEPGWPVDLHRHGSLALRGLGGERHGRGGKGEGLRRLHGLPRERVAAQRDRVAAGVVERGGAVGCGEGVEVIYAVVADRFERQALGWLAGRRDDHAGSAEVEQIRDPNRAREGHREPEAEARR